MNTNNFEKFFGPGPGDFSFIVVPKSYNDREQLSTFKVAERSSFAFIDESITDETADKEVISPGTILPYKIFPVLQETPSMLISELIKVEEPIFPGGRGLSLLWQLDKKIFTFGKTFISAIKQKEGAYTFLCLERSLPHGGESSEFVTTAVTTFNTQHKIILFYDYQKVLKPFHA